MLKKNILNKLVEKGSITINGVSLTVTKIKIRKTYFTHIHGWKYSSNSTPLKTQSYWDKRNGLGICGDWFGGPRLENGWLSATDLYNKIKK